MDSPDCNECGRTMDRWKSLGVYYCKSCSIMYKPENDKYWHTSNEED